jgi:hypothetical protein
MDLILTGLLKNNHLNIKVFILLHSELRAELLQKDLACYENHSTIRLSSYVYYIKEPKKPC